MTAKNLVRLAALWLATGCAESATSPVRLPTKLEAISLVSLSAPVGSAVVDLPSVIVRDGGGAPMAGVRVTFSVVLGQGFITGGAVTTNAAGVATLASWTLSTAAGPNIVEATTGALRTDFTATGIPGPPARILKVSGDNQFAPPGYAVPISPSVIVKDAYLNAVSGAIVTFRVESGGGSLAENTVTTSSSGIARLGGWTLGAEATQSVTATVDGVAPIVFVATASSDPCTFLPELSVGASASASLATSDCALADGQFGDSYTVPGSHGPAFSFTEISNVFDPRLVLATRDSVPVAEAVSTGGSGSASFKVLLTDDNYILMASSRAVGATGPYIVTTSTGSPSNTGCEEVFVTVGVFTAQSLAKGDCSDHPGQLADHYRIYLRAGTKIVITMSATQVDTRLELFDASGAMVAEAEENLSYTSLDSRLIFTAGTTGYYRINAMTVYGYGDYTLAIE